MNRGCLKGDLAKFRYHVIAPVLALAMTICGVGVANAKEFTDSAIHTSYGCLTTIANLAGVVVQFVSDGKGGITSGKGTLNFVTEVCTFTINSAGSSYSVNSDGTGTLNLKLTGGTAADGDEGSICSTFSGQTMHYLIVVERNGQQIELSGSDDFFTPGLTATPDSGDFILQGDCHRQLGS